MQVFKFGGASVKDAASVRNVADILRFCENKKTIVVISAMGKVTNRLEDLVKAYFFGRGDVAEILADLRKFHLSIAQELFPGDGHPVFDEIENIFVELSWAIEEPPAFTFDHHYDQVVSQGEMLSTRLVSAYLQSQGISNKWLDARDVIQTDNTFREGKVSFEESAYLVQSRLMPMFATSDMVVTQGFVGSTSENYTTTLGREGSDYTAALMAYFTDADHVTIWKDVPGVLSADPKVFSDTSKIDELSYHDAIELTYYGASVIHPKTIKPLQNKNIPLYVRSFRQPKEKGTVVRDNEHRITVTSYILKEKQILISIMPKDFSFIAEDNLGDIFKTFSKHHVHINLMQNSAISFSVCADDEIQKTLPLIEDLKSQFKVLYNENMKLLTIRNYDHDNLMRLIADKEVLLEQRSRHTVQVVVRGDVTRF
jgi:aspartate kinase